MAVIIPVRHPELPRKLPALHALAALLGVAAPTPAQWQELGEALTLGDPPMDAVVDWMYRDGLDVTWPLFEQALRHGITEMRDAPAPLWDFFLGVESPPHWLDPEQLRRGARVYRLGGVDGVYVARDVAFLGGYLASGFNKTLLRTGALEKGPAKRFAETAQWALDVTAENGLRPGGLGYRSTIQVRLIHALVRRRVATMPDWQGESWGLPINQTDMAATLVGALIAPIVGSVPMGIIAPRRDLDAAAHLVRYVGRLIGVQDSFLPVDFTDAVRVLYHTLAAITDPDETTPQLAVPMADDPLTWHYRNFPELRRRIARAQHLSIAGALLGPKAMRRLGLQPYMPPWYPLLRVPVNLVRSGLIRLPGGAERVAAHGRRAQEAFQRTLTGSDSVVIGESVEGFR
ncbi:oxygenase MpaB family protein [Nocardia carnea]|uniref:Oxygenase MpaB family protein n=1 Tax=Nocardia carnea TaxID=37328 RepID=A0ABW7TQM9_9NOCA|nr:oxygenase MpaB family protein [Nocardia carnea]